MIIVYSNEDYKAAVIKYCLLFKEISFLVVKKNKTQRQNISIEELNSSSLYDNFVTIDEENSSAVPQDNIKTDLVFPSDIKLEKNIKINFDEKNLDTDDIESGIEDDFKYTQLEKIEYIDKINSSTLPSLTKERKKANYIFNFNKKQNFCYFQLNQPLIIDELFLIISYINDKCYFPQLSPLDIKKRAMYKELLLELNRKIIEPFILIEDKLKKYLGFDFFVRLANKKLSKKLLKTIYLQKIFSEDFKKSLSELMKFLDKRYSKDNILFDYVCSFDILLLPLFFRLNLLKYFEFNNFSQYELLLNKINKLSQDAVFKKAVFNKCNGNIVH